MRNRFKEYNRVAILLGGVAAKDFGCLVINLINHNLKIKNNLENNYFFIDNAKIHNSRCTKNLFDNLNIIYNTPYSCDMNPIENVFGIVKANLEN